jgi:hypothetical protein
MKYLSFKDLKSAGIVNNWPTLLRMIERSGFPAGVRLSESRRAWPEAAVKSWLEARSIATPDSINSDSNAAV